MSVKSQPDTGLESANTEGSLGKVNNLSVFQPILMGLGINGTETSNVSLRPFRQNKYELSLVLFLIHSLKFIFSLRL